TSSTRGRCSPSGSRRKSSTMSLSERSTSGRISASSGRHRPRVLSNLMKHSLQLKLSQHLTLTPQLQQSIRLLQLSTVELNQELERYLAENPLHERADLASADELNPPPVNGESVDQAPP